MYLMCWPMTVQLQGGSAICNVKAQRLIIRVAMRQLPASGLVLVALLSISVALQDQIPGIELAARQSLLDYSTREGLAILKTKVTELVIPDVTKTFNLPVVGDFTLQLSNIHVAQFNVSSEEARLAIMDQMFVLSVTQVEADISFNWHWEKLGMTGTGQGELLLHGGTISLNFTVNNALPQAQHSAAAEPELQGGSRQMLARALGRQGIRSAASSIQQEHAHSAGSESAGSRAADPPTGQHPHINVVGSDADFQSVELSIKSYAADWLYQAVITLFNDQIKKGVLSGINGALRNDVPNHLNEILDTVPTRLSIKGLPFSTAFQVTLFTSTYVMVQGYGEVESDSDHPSTQELPGAASSQLPIPTKQPQHALLGSQPAAGPLEDLQRCPFEASPLPLSTDAIAADSHMVSLYLHQSIINCMAWGLYRAGMLQYSLVEGSIPTLHLTTDLLAMLIPQLPKQYPHQRLRIDITALTAPRVTFTAAPEGVGGTVLEAAYRTVLYVANDTLGNPQIASLVANLSISAQVSWAATVITGAQVVHTVESSSMPVSGPQWDQTVAWFIQNYAGLFPLQSLVDKFVHTPVTSLVALVNSATVAYDGWVALSGDVVLRQQ